MDGSLMGAPPSKTRKPYTLTKQRESWSSDEHERFIKALQLYNRDWKKIEAHVGTKTVVQIRSHAQKYFQKVIKSGSTEAIPPPRPKRKAAEPYGSGPGSGSRKGRHSSPEGTQRPGASVDNSAEGGSTRPGSATPTGNHDEAAGAHNDPNQAVSAQTLTRVYGFMSNLFEDTRQDQLEHLQALPAKDRQLAVKLLDVLATEVEAAGRHTRQAQQRQAQQQQQQQQEQQRQQQKQQAEQQQQQQEEDAAQQQQEQPPQEQAQLRQGGESSGARERRPRRRTRSGSAGADKGIVKEEPGSQPEGRPTRNHKDDGGEVDADDEQEEEEEPSSSQQSNPQLYGE